MNFEQVIPTLKQIKILYIQLKNRSHSISHRGVPSFEQHTKFVQNHPYRKWIILKDSDIAIGNIYIQYDNSLGLNIDSSVSSEQIHKILEEIYKSNSPLPAVPSVRFGEFFLNIATENKMLQKKLSNLGFCEIQRTFILSKYIINEWKD